MAIKHIDTIYMAGHYLCALINSDFSGLSMDDYSLFTDWENNYLDNFDGAVTYDVASDESEFTRDCVSDLMADCYKIEVYR